MDVASNFAVSIAPPPFQKEVDEARRDTQNRVSIPKPQASEGSERQSQIADERGSTSGDNSLLSAQQKGIADAKDDLNVDPDRLKRQRGSKKKKEQQDNKEKAESSSQQDEQAKDRKGKNQDDKKSSDLLDLDHDWGPPKEGRYNELTGCYEIPAYRHHKARSILLKFREQNVKFLEQFSDRSTVIGLINFALSRRYGYIIPHSPLGQVVEKLA